MNMKKKFMVLGLAIMLVVPAIAGAAIFKSGDNVTLDQPANENVYAAGGMVRETSVVNGDLLVAGGNLFLSGSTTKDVLAAGGQVDIAGTIGEDLRLVGGNLTLRAPVKGEAVIAGGSVSLLPEASIGGNLSVAAGQVTIDGKVNGNATIRAGKITLGDKAVINGKLTYYSAEQIVVPAGAQILGGINYHPVNVSLGKDGVKAALFGAAVVTGVIFKLIMLFLAAWILSAILGTAAASLVGQTVAKFWQRLGWGFVTLIVTPVLAVLLFITLLGIPLALGVIALYFFMFLLAYIFTVILTGSWLLKKLSKSEVYEANWKTAALGAIALTILAWIPVIGWIVGLVLFLVSLGAIGSLLLGWLRGSRA